MALITGTIFIGIVGCTYLTLVSLNAVSRYNSNRRMKQFAISNSKSPAKQGAKIIPLPQNAHNLPKERFIIKDSVSEEIKN